MNRHKRSETVRSKVLKSWSLKYWKFIQDNPERPWDWNEITNNNFAKEKTDFMIKAYHKHLMAYRIQYRWKNALVNPNCRVGINKIGRDMDYAGL